MPLRGWPRQYRLDASERNLTAGTLSGLFLAVQHQLLTMSGFSPTVIR
jgi:hypothetical protein